MSDPRWSGALRERNREQLLGETDENGFRRWTLPVQIRHQVTDVEGRRLERVVVELRDRGLSYSAISSVLDLYEGYSVTAEGVRAWAYRLGCPISEARSRATTAQNRRRGKVAA